MLRRLKSLRRFFCVAFQSRQPVGQRVKSAICLLLLIIGFNLLVYNWAFGYVIDENYGRIAPESVSNRDQVKHETICSSRSVPESCFSVVDHYDSKKNEVYRVLCTEGFDDEYETMVRLREPPGLDFQNSDTRTWKIDHKAISSQYIAALIAAPFMVGTLSLHNAMNIRKTMLNIGLGGGSLDMFLYKVAPEVNITVVELDPTMVELAHRWFGVVEDSHRRTIVADGIDVIRNAAKKNMTYDVVMLDACDGNRMFPCPAAVFRSDDVIVNIKKILKPMGCVVMNLLAMEGETMEKEIDTALELLKSHFPVCIKAWLPEDLNIPVVCLPYALQNSDSSLILYRKRFEKASAQLGLRDILKDVLFRSV
uniref:PABS domain-containing protein n=1 Tax=Steinernema glaseri TaxID=37863 RepID=A0A1I7ZH41_9BILA